LYFSRSVISFRSDANLEWFKKKEFTQKYEFGVPNKNRRNAASVQIQATSIKRYRASDPDLIAYQNIILLKKILHKEA